jgi:Cys-rich protein (TIGR01571 family)
MATPGVATARVSTGSAAVRTSHVVRTPPAAAPAFVRYGADVPGPLLPPSPYLAATSALVAGVKTRTALSSPPSTPPPPAPSASPPPAAQAHHSFYEGAVAAEGEEDAEPSVYSTPLCACCDDMPVCFASLVAPCYLSAWVMSNARGEEGCDGPWCVISGLGCLVCNVACLWADAWAARSHVLHAYNMHQDVCPRIFLCVGCCWCMLCQDAREVKARRRAALARTASSVSINAPGTSTSTNIVTSGRRSAPSAPARVAEPAEATPLLRDPAVPAGADANGP